MNKDDHGNCKNCGFDLNGERVYDYFLKDYGGDEAKAEKVAEMYGCRKDYGRFGKAIYVKTYTDHGKLREWKCPSCGKECY